jgi:hypothetical protein
MVLGNFTTTESSLDIPPSSQINKQLLAPKDDGGLHPL